MAGLPTATNNLRDMKRRYYCREENQDDMGSIRRSQGLNAAIDMACKLKRTSGRIAG